ncbi:MAG: hypothetical protein ACHREM_11730 [Polyangiales bacterium]
MNATTARSLSSLFIVVAIASAAACSNSNTNSNGGGTITTSVDASKNLSALNPTDLTTYCHNVHSYEASAVTAAQGKAYGCALSATAVIDGQTGETAAQALSACQSAYRACESATPDAGSGSDAGAATDPCTTLQAEAAQCNATVADINKCIEEQTASAKTIAAAGENNCTPSAADGVSPTPTCDSIQPTCPTVAALF